MRKNRFSQLATLIVLLLAAGPVFGHTLFMNLTDNDDGIVSVEGNFPLVPQPQICPCICWMQMKNRC